MSVFQKAVDDAVGTLERIRSLEPALLKASELVRDCLLAGGKLLVCGNGGSAADGADFATEYTCRFVRDRKAYPAINLSACGSLLTALGNDYGYERSFARQVEAFGKSGDVLVAISTSGRSANIHQALETARASGVRTLALLGKDGGKCRGLAEVELIVPSSVTARIQEGHKFLLHSICEQVEDSLAVE
jgi:D-sedoheptulose 7-phosphate isomerase